MLRVSVRSDSLEHCPLLLPMQQYRKLLPHPCHRLVLTLIRSKSKVHALYLNLDPAVTLPIMLEDGHASDSFLGSLDKKARSPTGKFYKEPHASALVDTLRPEGSFARMVLGDTASDDDKQHFNRFVSRLLSGELVSSFSQSYFYP